MIKIMIIGNGKIGNILQEKITNKYEITNNIDEAKILALCISSEKSKDYIDTYSDKIILNFSSLKSEKENVINGIGCSTLSVLKVLNEMKENNNDIYNNIEEIDVTTLFPLTAISNNSKNNNIENNKVLYVLNHKHQQELIDLTKLNINMVHILTPAKELIISTLFIKFNKKIDLEKILNNEKYMLKSKSNQNWIVISTLDNLREPVDYMINNLENYLKINHIF